MFNNPVSKWWMNRDPAVQYMYWIIAFILMLFGGITTVALMFAYGLASTMWLVIIGGTIAGFVGLFMVVILFLTVIWPHLYEGYGKEASDGKER